MKPLEALRALGTGREPPAETKQRVYGALLASLAVAAAGAGAAQVAPPAPTTMPPAATPLLGGAASSKALLVATGIWLLGGVTGAVLYGALHPQQVRVVYVDRPLLASPLTSASPEAMPSAGFPSVPRTTPSSSLSAGRSAAPAPSASPASRAGSDLAVERALLDSARASAAHGEPAQVLELVDQHRRQFAHGRLVEEREALAIRALLALGRSGEARARANAFHATYPHSFLTPVVDSALSAP